MIISVTRIAITIPLLDWASALYQIWTVWGVGHSPQRAVDERVWMCAKLRTLFLKLNLSF